MYWLEISVITDGEAAEAVSELLRPFAHGQGVVFEQLGDADSPEPDALEPEVTVKIYVPEDRDVPALRRSIEEALYHMNRLYPMPEPKYRKLQHEDWANAWRKNYRPFRIGRQLWIQPSWREAETVEDDDIVITLDPGMAFGTGLHPTTQMCIQSLEDLFQFGDTVLDVGTGSGILAIAAAKLGASKVLAFDTDRQAILAARENAALNNVERQLEFYQGALAATESGPWDLVLVNILAPVIKSLLTEYNLMGRLADGGRMILSGIIEDQADGVRMAIVGAGGVVRDQRVVRDWICLIVGKEKTP